MSTFTSYSESAQTNGPALRSTSTPSTIDNATDAPATTPPAGNQNDDGGKKKKAAKRRKVNHACLYCRRSHMTCDEGRPCQRWWVLDSNTLTLTDFGVTHRSIKREIGHLCHDERRQKPAVADKPLTNDGTDMSRNLAPGTLLGFTCKSTSRPYNLS